MLTEKFKEEALKRLEQMTAEDFIRVFEKIGSQRIGGTDNTCLSIEEDLNRYCIFDKLNVKVIVPEQNVRMSDTDQVYSREMLYVLAA